MRARAAAPCLALGLAGALAGCTSTSSGFLFEPAEAGVADAGGAAGSDANAPDAPPLVDGQAYAPAPSLPPSAGCGKPPAQDLARYMKHWVQVTGATLDPSTTVVPQVRGYAVWLPPGYDPTIPTRTVFVASGCFSSSTNETGYMSAEGDRNAIYVGLDPAPPNISPQLCFDDSGTKSTEWEFFALVAADVEQSFCVDKNQELFAGRDSGGTLANMLGCFFSKPDPNRALGPELMLRAQFSIASALPMDLPACGGPIAALWIHDRNESPPVSGSLASLDRVLRLNGCLGSPTVDWATNAAPTAACKKYVECPPAYPVVFCETTNMGRQAGYNTVRLPLFKQFSMELAGAR